MARLCDIHWSSSVEVQETSVPLESFDDAAIDRILGRIRNAGGSSVLMHARPTFAKEIRESLSQSSNVDEETPDVLKLYLVQLYDPELTSSTIEILHEKALEVILHYTSEEIALIERLSRSQSDSKFWYRF